MKTFLLKERANTVYHQLSSLESRCDIDKGISKALRLITALLTKCTTFDLIIDLRESPNEKSKYSFENHQRWSRDFKSKTLIKNHVDKTAIVGPDKDKFRAEKRLLDSGDIQFFTTLKEALDWLEE